MAFYILAENQLKIMKDLHKKLALLIFECFNNRDFDPVQNKFSENVIMNFPGVGDIAGLKRVIIFMKSLLRKYPKLEFSISEVIMEENRAVVVWKNQGERVDGQAYSNNGITLFHFTEEKIVLISDYFKDTSFTQN